MRLQRVLFGYYKDRIKGSNLERHRRKWCLITLGVFTVLGSGSFFLPYSYRLREKMRNGEFDDPPEWQRKKDYMRIWVSSDPDFIVKSMKDYENSVERSIRDEFHDV